MTCASCNGYRWLHAASDTGPEVEACDACTDGGDRETRAIQLHRLTCGCDWPENRGDEPDRVFYGGRTRMPVTTFEPAPDFRVIEDPEDLDGDPDVLTIPPMFPMKGASA